MLRQWGQKKIKIQNTNARLAEFRDMCQPTSRQHHPYFKNLLIYKVSVQAVSGHSCRSTLDNERLLDNQDTLSTQQLAEPVEREQAGRPEENMFRRIQSPLLPDAIFQDSKDREGYVKLSIASREDS